MVNKQITVFIQKNLLQVCFTLGLGYFAFSFFSEGFYQHDEVSHYLNMLRFWHQPESIMGNWAKPGFKLIYAPVALFGVLPVKLFNSFLAAASCFVAYKVMEQLGYRKPWLALIFLAFQPFWVELSFRTYSEILTAFLLITSVWAFYAKKHWLAALLMSYILTIRQEFYPIVGLYGVFLLSRKQWKSTLLVLVFPFIQHIAGWLLFDNPLYLYHSIFGFSSAIQDAYPRQGGAHYLLMTLPVFGGLVFTFFLVFVIQAFIQRKSAYWPILIPIVLFFAIHILFSMQTFKIGPSTGGNLRYLMVIAPLIAVLAAIGAERMYGLKTWQERSIYLWWMIPILAVAFMYMSFEHNHLKYTYKRDFSHILVLILTLEVMLLGLHQKWISLGILGISVLSSLLAIRPLPLSDEDRVAKEAAMIITDIYEPGTKLIMSHSLFPYYLGKIREEFDPVAERITKDVVENAEPGALIIWDAHYSFKPRRDGNTLPLDYFLANQEEFTPIREPIFTENKVFSVYFFRKNQSK